MQDKKKSFLRGASILAIAGLICKVIGAVYKIPLRNQIGAVAMGIYTTVYPIYTFLLIFSTSGIPTAISKLVAEERSKGNYEGAHKVFISSLKLLIAIGVLTSALMLIFSSQIAQMLLVDSWEPVAAISLSLLFVSLLSAYRGYYQGMLNMMPTAITQIIEQIIKLAAGFYFAILWKPLGPEMSAAGALLGITLSELVAFIVIFILYQRDKKKFLTFTEKSRNKEKYMSRLMAIAIPMTLGGAIKPLVDTVDSVMVKSILENTLSYGRDYINALFGFLKNDCGTLINMPAILTVALSMSLVPAVIDALMGVDGKQEVRRISSTGIKLAFIIGLPCTAGFLTLSREILSFLYSYESDTFDGVFLSGESQLAMAGNFLMILSFGVLFLAIIQTAAGILQGLGKAVIPVVNLAIGMAVKIAMNWLLVPITQLNIYGVPLGTVTCYAIAAILDVIFVIKHTGLKFNFKNMIFGPLASAATMSAFILIAKFAIEAISGEPLGKLTTIIVILIAAIVYFVSLAIFKVLDESDIELMPCGNKLKKLLEKFGVQIRPWEN